MKDLVWAAYGFDIKGENIWFCSYWDNFLCCYSLAEKRVIRIEEIPEHGKQREFLFSNVAIVDTNLIALIPSNAASLFLYNIENRSFMEFPVDIPEGIHNKFCGYAKYNDYLYIFPVNCDVIIRLNLKSKEIHRISDWNNEIETTGSIMAFQMKNCICGENIFLISAVSNKIMRFRMSDFSDYAKSVLSVKASFVHFYAAHRRTPDAYIHFCQKRKLTFSAAGSTIFHRRQRCLPGRTGLPGRCYSLFIFRIFCEVRYVYS